MRLSPPLPPAPDSLVLTAAIELLTDPHGSRPTVDGRPACTPSTAVAEALAAQGLACDVMDLDQAPAGSIDVLLLVADELAAAGEHAEGLVDRCAALLRPGGLLLASTLSELPARVLEDLPLTGPGSTPPLARGADADESRRFTAAGLRGLLAHRGFELGVLAAPGARSRLAQRPPHWDLEGDRAPGLLDTTPRLLAAATSPASALGRSRTFFSSLAPKVVAAAVICRDAHGRLLCVHDTFKGHWTIPGGVVDADEAPAAAAERETWEEAGVRVHAGAVLGTFAASWPDRIILVFEAAPVDPTEITPAPVHLHEVDKATWLPLDDALARLGTTPRRQVKRCLGRPHHAWRD